MDNGNLHIDEDALNHLARHPNDTVEGKIGRQAFHARIALPDYDAKITEHYGDLLPEGLKSLCLKTSIPFEYRHFGLICEFDGPVELRLHSEEMHLFSAPRGLIARFGPLLFRNAYLDEPTRSLCQKNIFPHLNFHKDRDLAHANIFSLFTRNPYDPLQKEPRTTSTILVADIVAYLQSLRENKKPPTSANGAIPSTYRDIFGHEDMKGLFGKIAFEMPWDLPSRSGEIGMLDNRGVLHASYHKNPHQKGYHIGARYLE